MKRYIAFCMALIMVLALTACKKTYDLEYDMTKYEFFSRIFDEKPKEEWMEMGKYTILLKGLDTRVLVDMDGMVVLSVRAYGQKVDVNIEESWDSVNANIQSADGAILVNEYNDWDGNAWIITKKGCHAFYSEGDYFTMVHPGKDGSITYTRTLNDYETTFNQDDYAPLYCCTSRDHLLQETGKVELKDGEAVLLPEQTLVVSDICDLDTMFAEAKAMGSYEQYETVDQLLAANAVKTEE